MREFWVKQTCSVAAIYKATHGLMSRANGDMGIGHQQPAAWAGVHAIDSGLAGGTRTPYPCLRRTLLYPDELRPDCLSPR